MRLLLLGINHRTAPVALRESLAIGGERLPAVLNGFKQNFPGVEAVLLSTCNRTELYIARPSQSPPDIDALRRFLADQCGADLDALTAASIHREQQPAVHHLFRVTAGLDAMAVGETQIIGQVRRAYEAAQLADTTGPTLHRIFQSALRDVKQAHQQSGVAALQQSVSSMAVEFAGNLFESFTDKTVVGLGAGEITKATLRRMLSSDQSPAATWIVNRTASAGSRLAASLGLSTAMGETISPGGHHGGARSWEDLDEVLVEADIVITGTAAAEPVVTAAQFKPLLRRRRNRPLFLIDLAVPRDVEPAVGTLPNVYLYNIDDLNSALADVPRRREKIDRCEALVRGAAERCLGAAQHQDLGALVRQLRNKLLTIGEAERERTQRKMQALHAAGRYDQIDKLLDEHTHRLINKVLHLPLSRLEGKGKRSATPSPGEPKEAAESGGEVPMGFYAAALRRLFDLDETATVGDAQADAPDVANPGP